MVSSRPPNIIIIIIIIDIIVVIQHTAYLGSNISSTERDLNLAKAWNSSDKLSTL